MCDLGAQLTASWNQLYVGFLVREENWRTRRKTLGAEKRTNTNSTHLWRWVRESNPSHIGGRRVLSPLRHPCFPQCTCERYSGLGVSALAAGLSGLHSSTGWGHHFVLLGKTLYQYFHSAQVYKWIPANFWE